MRYTESLAELDSRSGLTSSISDNYTEEILDTGRIIAELKTERDRLSRAIAILEGQSSNSHPARDASGTRTPVKAKRTGGHLTPAGRKRLSEMMKKRWAERRKKRA